MLRVALSRRVGAKAWGRVSASSRTADATRRARQLGLTARVRCPECRRLREPRNVWHAGSNGSFPPKWTSGMGYTPIRPNPHRYKARAPNDGQQPILET
jgi:hypothetical protein